MKINYSDKPFEFLVIEDFLNETQKKEVSFNLISATCQNIPDLIDNGSFRQDFYFRINSYELTIPPLRERPNDIQLFIEKSVQAFSSEVVFEKKALDLLIGHDWPGNVRQLNDTIKKFEINNQYYIMREDVVQVLGVQKVSNNELLSKKQKEFISNIASILFQV